MLEHEDILKWCNEGERVDMVSQTNQVGGSACIPISPCLIFIAHSVVCWGVRTWRDEGLGRRDEGCEGDGRMIR